MPFRRTVSAAVAAITVVGVASVPTLLSTPAQAVTPGGWAAAGKTGNVRLPGEVPLSVRHAGTGARSLSRLLGAHAASAPLTLNFSLPLRNTTVLNTVIAREAKTHHYASRAALYAEFAPPVAQVTALRTWLKANDFTVTHVGADRTSVAARATTAQVNNALSVKVNDYVRSAYTNMGVKVPAFTFYANSANPQLPARLGVSSVSGLSNVAQFFTDAQLAAANKSTTSGPNGVLTRAGGGYYPEDVRAMYDESGHGVDATGQTIGFTLWGAGEQQPAMTSFANTTSDPLITVDPACVATNNSPSVPSACTTVQEAPNHLVSILENGNTNGSQGTFEFAGNDETALDIEQAHGMAPGSGMKYYLSDCSNTVPVGSGLSNATCNGSDVGMEEAVEDAADDPTLHTVSNSWGYGGDTEFGNADPFKVATEASLAIAAAAGTTFWFSTGDAGSYESGYPADSQYVVGVGGTSDYSTTNLAAATPSTVATRSTATTWAAGGSWCSTLDPRPSWQTGANVTAKASCPGRVVPDISSIADTNTSVYEAYTSNNTGAVRTGGVGGTSVAAPEMNGMEATTEAFLAKQTYGGAVPAIGFEGPKLYQLGNSANASAYFLDVDCGNTASPSGGPDGDAAGVGWDPATGFGELDWYNYSIGYAISLGATGLTQPTSISKNYSYGCAQTPTNASERSISLPTKTVGYSLGAPSGTTPWPATYLTRNAWGATNNFLKTADGGATWQTTNSDMLGVACVSAVRCIEVGDGGRIRVTSDSGSTWTYVASQFNKALTSIACPSATTCFAAGDRGTVLKSTDAGATWRFTNSADGNPIYGLSCPSTTVCYAVDNYAHYEKTADGGTTWSLGSTPATTQGVNVPGSGGPNPFAGLFGITCSDVNTCVAVGGFPATGTDSPIVITTNGGTTWTLETSNSGANNYLYGVTCVGTTCYAVGRTGAIVTSTNGGVSWTAMTSNTTNLLTGITCSSVTTCVATGQAGTVDILNGTTWTPVAAAPAAANFLAAITCLSGTSCLTVGKQGVTIAFDPTNPVASATLQAGGGTSQTMTSISCVDATHCVTVGGAGTILTTADGGQTWLPRTSTTTTGLTGVSCVGLTCEAVGGVIGNAAVIVGSADGGVTWVAQTSGSTVALSAVTCTSATACVAVGAGGKILVTANAGATWTAPASPVTANLSGVTCPTAANCYAVGALNTATPARATIIASTDGGNTWTAQASNSPQALTSIGCANDVACFAAGAIGTVVTTVDGGNAWAQQGNPISGPTTALNAGPTGITALNAVTCNAVTCAIGAASAGDIMTTPLLTVTVHATSKFGSPPPVSGVSPSDPSITYSPATQAGNVTGTLTCSTTAKSTSDPGTYPVSECSGLSDNGYSVIYDLDDSSAVIGQATQTINFPAIPDMSFGAAPFNPNAVASSGLPVSYSSAGNCQIVNGQVVITGAGACTVTAMQGGNADVTAAPNVSRSFSIAKANQTIAFGSLDPKTYGNANFEIDPTASSGLPVSVSATGPCTLDSALAPANVTITGGGTCSITASQGGNQNYQAAASVTQSFDVAKENQTITFGALSDRTFNDAPFDVSATASSGLPVGYTAAGQCTVSGSTVTVTGAGSCTITASQPGNDNYNPAPDVAQTFTIAQDAQTITFGALPDVAFGSGDVTVSATASSGLTVLFSVSGACQIDGSTVHPTGVGTCTVTATQAGDSNYRPAATVVQAFTITKGDQTITFAAPADRALGSAPFTVPATASSGLPVGLSTSGNVCVVDAVSHVVTLSRAGTCTIEATQDGNDNWSAAPPVTRSFTVTKGTVSVQVTVTPTKPTAGKVTYAVSVPNTADVPSTGSVKITAGTKTCTVAKLSSAGTGSCSIVETAGTYSVKAAYAGDANYRAASVTGEVVVAKATPAIALTTTVTSPSKGKHTVLVRGKLTAVSGVALTGSLSVNDGAGQKCTVTIATHNAASCRISVAPGRYTITVTYSGNANYRSVTGQAAVRVTND